MNWVNFIYLGPGAIWVLAGTIILSTIVGMINTRKIVSAQKNNTYKIIDAQKDNTSELRRGVCELEKAAKELNKDTTQLNQGNLELKEEMERTRTSMDSSRQMLRRWHSLCFPWVKIDE